MVASWVFSPLTNVRRVSGSVISSSVTRSGPTGVEASHAFPWSHWWVLYW